MKRKKFIPESDENRCKCGAPGQYDHPCPYRVEISENYTSCNCCPKCTANCAEDV